MWPFDKWKVSHDTADLREDMSRAFGKKYNPDDRHADFVQLFRGSPQGLRVLYEILSWGHIYNSSVPKGAVDVNTVLVNEGERRLALRILGTVNVEPVKVRPTRTTHTENVNG